MPSTKLVIGGAAAGALGVRVARSLYGRWRLLPPADRRAHRRLRRGHQGEGARPCAARTTAPRPRPTCARPARRWPRPWWRPPRPTPRWRPRTWAGCATTCAASWSVSPTADIKASRSAARPRQASSVGSRAPPGTLLVNISDSAHTSGPSVRHQAATLEFREATKRYPGQDEPAVDELSLTVPAGEICVLVGPVGLRQDHRDADGQPDDRRSPPATSCSTARASASASRRSCGASIGYAIQQVGLFPHLIGGGQHRHRPAPARLGPRAHPRPRGRAARAREPRRRTRRATATRPSCPAASASGSAWPARSPSIRR